MAEKSTAWTPAISLINGLKVALDMMRAEGWPALYARLTRLGLKLEELMDASRHDEEVK